MTRAVESRRRTRGLAMAVAAVALSVMAALAAAQQPAATTQLDDAQQKELDTLATQLRDPALPAEQRKVFANLLLHKDWRQADDVLIDVLHGKDSGGRLAVVEALAETGRAKRLSSRLIEPVVLALGDASDSLRDAAARALASCGDDIVDRLGDLLLETTGPIRMRAGIVEALSRMRPSNKVIDALVSVEDAELLGPALRALNTLTFVTINDIEQRRKWWRENRDSPEPDRIWREVLRLRQENRQLLAGQRQLEDRLIETLRSLFDSTPQQPQQIELLLRLLADRQQPAARIAALDLIDKKFVSRNIQLEELRGPVLQRLADDSGRVRSAAADLAPFLGDKPAAIAALLEQETREPDSGPRVRMIWALGHLQANEAVPRLLGHLRNSADRAVSAEAAMSLGLISAKSRNLPAGEIEPVVAALLECYGRLDGRDPQVRDALITAMAHVADSRLTPVFLNNLASNAAPVRQACVRGLGNLAPLTNNQQLAGEVVEALVGRLNVETDFGVRVMIISALAQHGPGRRQLTAVYDRTNPNAEADASVRKQAWDRLIVMLRGADKATQLNWIVTLKQSSDPAAAGRLIELLRIIEPATAREPWTPAEAAVVAEHYADVLLRGRFAGEAADRYLALYRPLRQGREERARVIAQKYLQALLESNQLSTAIAVMKERQPIDQPGEQPMVDAVLARLRSLLNNGQSPQTVVDWAQELRQQLPGIFATGPAAEPLSRLVQQASERTTGPTTRPD